MTRQELLALVALKIERLPAHAQKLVESYFDTRDRGELLRRFAEEAEKTWGAPSAAPVEPGDWPDAHLNLIFQLHRVAERDQVLEAQTMAALAVLDKLEPVRRALLCWRFQTTNRRKLASRAVAVTLETIKAEPSRSFAQTLPASIQNEIDLQVSEIDNEYRVGLDGQGIRGGQATIDPTRVRDILVRVAVELEEGILFNERFLEFIASALLGTRRESLRGLLQASLDVYVSIDDATGDTEELHYGVAQALRGIALAWSNIQEISPPLQPGEEE